MRTLGFCSGILAGAAGFAHASVCFVDGNAAGANDGSSWASAYLDLQSALVSAACGEIWVAAFVYKPANSNASFNIAPGTAVYGGFSGTETLRDQRNPAAHLTVLSGDIDNNDCAGLCVGGVTADATQIVGVNAHRVVVMDGTGTPITSSTVLDGFTITAGDADPSGGGLFCDGEGAGKACSPMLANLVFSGNRASAVGGAIFCYADSGGVCSPVLSNAVFRGNHAEGQGGAIYCDGENGSTCNPTLTDVTFESNSAGQWGGAMYDDGLNGASSPVLNRVAFVANDAVYGGAMYNEGTGGASNPTLTNVTFSGNTASRGGAMLNDAQSGGSASPIVTNATFAGNHASAYGGAINSYDVGGTSNPLLTNVILWGNTATLGSPVTIGNATIAYAMVEGGCPAGNSCSHLVAGDPRLGPLRDNGGATRTLDLGSGSAAIDAGSDAACPAQDQRGVTRPQGLHCDIGAVETDRVFADNFDGTPVP